MPTVIVQSAGAHARVPVRDLPATERNLQAVYARERIEEVVRGILEDALSPSRLDVPPWHDDAAFGAEFALAVSDITDATAEHVAQRMALLLETAPPLVAARLAAVQRFPDHP